MRIELARWTAAMAVSLVAAISPCVLQADRIQTNDGRVLTGSIVSENATEVAVRTDVGTLRIRRANIVDIVRENTLPEEVAGDTAYSAGNFEQAKQQYEEALGKVPAQSEAVTRLREKIARATAYGRQASESQVSQQLQQARTYMAQKQYDAALQVLDSLKDRMPTDEMTSAVKRLMAETHFAKAQQANDSVNLIEMENQLRAAINAYEPYYRAHLAYGELQLRSSLTEAQGIESILRGLKYGEVEMSEEERVRYHYMIAKRYFAKQDYDNAAAHFIEAMRSQGEDSPYKDALDLAVQSYIKMGERSIDTDFHKTIENLTGALRLNPNNADAHFLLGRIYRDTGETSRAIESLTKVLEINPAYENAHYYLALAYNDVFDWDNALKHLDDELKNDPTDYDALVERAVVQIRLAAYDKADVDLQEAIKVEGSKWHAYLVRAELEFVRENYEQAQQNLMKVLSIKPDAVEAHIQMGKVLQVQKNYDSAKSWFTNVIQYLEKAPSLSFRYRQYMAEAQTALGEIDLAQESPRQAETRFQKALENLKNFPLALNRIGDVKRRLGTEATEGPTKTQLLREAEAYYKRAIEQNPRNPEFYLSLGILYHKQLKDTQKAIANYRKYLDLGGRDLTNVNKWIEEAGGGIIGDEMTTATMIAGSTTTGTIAAASTTSPTTTFGALSVEAPSTTPTAPAVVTPDATAVALPTAAVALPTTASIETTAPQVQ